MKKKNSDFGFWLELVLLFGLIFLVLLGTALLVFGNLGGLLNELGSLGF